MLKRTKYSRLHNDSLSSLEDRPQRMLPLKRDLCLESDFAKLDPDTPAHHRSSTLREFIPRVANIRLQSPVSVRVLGAQTKRAGEGTTDGQTDRRLPRKEWCSGTHQRFWSQPSLTVPPSAGQNQTHSALSCTKRPITLHGMACLPWDPSCPPRSQHRDAQSCLKAPSAWTANRAVHHHIKYMGNVEVTQSMRTLGFDTRIQVTREAISRLCEKISTKTAVKTKRSACKGLSAVLGQINLQFSGSRIILAVSTDSVTLIAASSLQKIAHHPMQAISFASGGDPDMADYIAYVAKDLFNQRACHVLECPRGRASEVINSIGQAFETRFCQLVSHTSALPSISARSAVRLCHKWSKEKETTVDQKTKEEGGVSERRDYYNVNPRQTPPAGGVEDLWLTRDSKQDADAQGVCSSQPVSLYENCSIPDESTAPQTDSVVEVSPDVGPERGSLLSETQIQDLIQEEGWFHGRLGREQAESLLTCSGDFLVRESSSASGQYVLSGMEGATVRHLLLVDPHGQVRTRDQVFLSIGHLVRFHMENQMPIVSGSSELSLKQPVLQRH
uniref:SHC-transforming protein 1-like n=1 Tax=Scatophagus argus TaxID=75038 RepID=UPI001ED85F73|nr:SHC-transforming protein 1-like [Scatophagus argus]XP_046248739.1 SHC-transforming protein 1-like [Scatophagus argus]XP_046248749.1 SHC-transforming protein 1-like [Scatophagus argus]XP_046248759.1 SHC-transforming protein 1-like [Scatophagus argus]